MPWISSITFLIGKKLNTFKPMTQPKQFPNPIFWLPGSPPSTNFCIPQGPANEKETTQVTAENVINRMVILAITLLLVIWKGEKKTDTMEAATAGSI